jgi:hypothetical protein
LGIADKLRNSRGIGVVKYVIGNLFDSEAVVIVNTVNCEGVMGKGIAYQFKQALYEVRKAYFKKEDIPTCNKLDKKFRKSDQKDYRAMPMAHSAQGTVKQVFDAWDSFWAALKSYRKDKSKGEYKIATRC